MSKHGCTAKSMTTPRTTVPTDGYLLATAAPQTNIQTTLVPPGAATMVELKLEVPGMYMLEDHHISRLQKGARR